MIDREKIRKRVIDKVAYGYSTHRVMNRILEESLLELADALIEELETPETPKVRKHKE